MECMTVWQGLALVAIPLLGVLWLGLVILGPGARLFGRVLARSGTDYDGPG